MTTQTEEKSLLTTRAKLRGLTTNYQETPALYVHRTHRRSMGEITWGVLARIGHRDGLGQWYAGCGWVWENPSRTVRALRVLERQGYVVKIGEDRYGPQYHVTAHGIKRLLLGQVWK